MKIGLRILAVFIDCVICFALLNHERPPGPTFSVPPA